MCLNNAGAGLFWKSQKLTPGKKYPAGLQTLYFLLKVR